MHIKQLVAGLKKVYQTISEEETTNNLILFNDKYPFCVKSWEENWDILSTFFAYPTQGFNRQFREITKNKPSFTNDDIRKMLYLASQKIVGRRTQRQDIRLICL